MSDNLWSDGQLFDPAITDTRKPWQGRKDDPTPFERGMEGSARAAQKWTDLEKKWVDEAIELVALVQDTFTADDIWAQIAGRVRVTKGLAGRLNAARHRGMIEPTGQVTFARRGGDHDHAQRLAVWRSLLRKGR